MKNNNIQKAYCLIAFLVHFTCANAVQVSQGAAFDIASKYFKKPELVTRSTLRPEGDPAFYIFTNSGHKGFVIVSGESDLPPIEIVGQPGLVWRKRPATNIGIWQSVHAKRGQAARLFLFVAAPLRAVGNGISLQQGWIFKVCVKCEERNKAALVVYLEPRNAFQTPYSKRQQREHANWLCCNSSFSTDVLQQMAD